jgi:hypothetical protein
MREVAWAPPKPISEPQPERPCDGAYDDAHGDACSDARGDACASERPSERPSSLGSGQGFPGRGSPGRYRRERQLLCSAQKRNPRDQS